jgi:hypothetical protein
MKRNKTHNAFLLPALLLIWAIVFYASSSAANPCTTVDGYLDTAIGIMNPSNDSPPNKGIGGTGRSDDQDGKGIGGTGAVSHNNGIGGTGQIASQGNSNLIYVRGTIHAFGSVCVNGIEIEYTAETPVSSDTNQKLAASSLQVGQVVDIIAEKNVGNGMPKAKNIEVRFPVQGPVTKINPDGRLINVMGKSVQLTGSQVGNSIKVGDSIRVSGLQSSGGQIMATFIEAMPKQTPPRAAPSKTKVIPSGITDFSVQGFVQKRTPEGRVVIEGQSFDLGVSGKDIEIGTRMIVSGKRQQNGIIKASGWVRERVVIGTGRQQGQGGDSGRRGRNRRHGGGRDDDKEDHSGKGRTERPDDKDRIDNSGKGSSKSDRPDRVDKPDKSGSSDRPDRVDKPDKSGSSDRPDRVDKPDDSGRNDRPDRIDRLDDSGRLERPERPDRSGKGSG